MPDAKRPPQNTTDVYQMLRHYMRMHSNLQVTAVKISNTAYDCNIFTQVMYKSMAITRNDRQNIRL